MNAPERTLILVDGGLAAFVACAAFSEERALAAAAAGEGTPAVEGFALAYPANGAGHPLRAAAVKRHAVFAGLTALFPRPTASKHASEGHAETLDLIAAAYIAAEHRCTRIIWPVSAAVGENISLDLLASITDRAMLVARLVAIDPAAAHVSELHIETPYSDLTDRQIADLAIDAGVPIEMCWWHRPEIPEALIDQHAERDRLRWLAALASVGWTPPVLAS